MSPLRWFRDLRVSRKLMVVIFVHLLHAGILLVVTAYGMKAMSASRAYVEGEGLWSKAQKEGMLHLVEYASSHDPDDYAAFLDELDVTLGDRQARLELDKAHPDMDVVRDGFLRGRLHPDDIEDVSWLYRNFGTEPHLAKAIAIWVEADEEIDVFLAIGERMHQAVLQNDTTAIGGTLKEAYASDARLTILENAFSRDLGNGVRWLTGVVNTAAIGLTVLFVGLALVISASAARQITRSLRQLQETAQAVAKGDLGRRVALEGRDEVAAVGRTFDDMAQRLQDMLEKQRELEETRANAAAQEREIARLGELDAFRTQFINTAAHELRTPLTPLRAQLHVLRKHRSAHYDPDEQRSLDLLHRNVERISVLIEDLMQVSQYKAGRMNVEPRPADLHKVVSEAVDVFRAPANLKHVQVQLEARGHCQGTLDANRMSQVLFNLLSNALKFTPDGGTVQVVCDGRNAEELILEVRDTGIGLRPEAISKLFQPFSQVHEAAVAQTGSGLGLFICRAIVEMHGGRIAVTSPGLGHGTTFTIQLPRHAAGPLQNESRSPSPP